MPVPKTHDDTGADVDTLIRQATTGVRSAQLGATPEAVRAARSYVADVLTAWSVQEDLIDMARLLTSELATNAITHGGAAGGTFTLEVRSFGCCLGVEVHDSSPRAPVLRSVADDTEHGRGLLLVAEVADSWGYYFADGCKHVWFHLHVAAPAADGIGRRDACGLSTGRCRRRCKALALGQQDVDAEPAAAGMPQRTACRWH